MAKIVYPLEDVLVVKKRRVEEAERQLKRRQEELQKEEEKLRQREKERDKVKEHFKDKMRQLRMELDAGTTAPKIRQMKDYMDIVKERLAQEEQKVAQQKEQVKVAARKVEEAKEELNLRRKEVDKLEEHKVSWIKGVKKEIEQEEAKEQDELGNIVYTLKKREK